MIVDRAVRREGTGRERGNREGGREQGGREGTGREGGREGGEVGRVIQICLKHALQLPIQGRIQKIFEGSSFGGRSGAH